MTIKQQIETMADEARALKTVADISAFIEKIGCKTQARWGRAVIAITEVGGPDYYVLRDGASKLAREELSATVTHELTLIVDAKARCQRFAICAEDGNVLWYGIFFEDDKSFSYGDRDEQSACECAAARKAIWFASQAAEAHALTVASGAGSKRTAIRLTLKVDAQWLTSLAGKASILASDARRFGVDLRMEWIPGTENPADRWTTANGFKKWSDNALSDLIRPVHAENILQTA